MAKNRDDDQLREHSGTYNRNKERCQRVNAGLLQNFEGISGQALGTEHIRDEFQVFIAVYFSNGLLNPR